jgi:hypothetical protein
MAMGRSLFLASIATTSMLLLVVDTGGAGRSAGIGVHEAAAAQACGPGCQTFRLQMTFIQHRPWTYHYEQVGGVEEICTRTTDGQGSDDLRLTGSGSLVLPQSGRPSAFLNGATGKNSRVGTMTTTVGGATCARSAVFPSTWRIITQIDTSVTAAAPTTGCGRQTIVKFPSFKLSGNTLRVRWTSTGKVPDFKDCPFFDGANEASEGNMLPKGDVFDVSAKINLRALRNAARRRGTASGEVKLGATETCANLQQPCPDGVSYHASGSVEGTVKFVFTR